MVAGRSFGKPVGDVRQLPDIFLVHRHNLSYNALSRLCQSLLKFVDRLLGKFKTGVPTEALLIRLVCILLST